MPQRLCCVESGPARAGSCSRLVWSDGLGEFGERGCDATVRARFDSEFVVAAPDVLHERVTADDHIGGLIAFEAAYRSEPGLEPAVVRFDPVVRVLRGVVKRARYELIDDRRERPGRSVTTSAGVP